MDKNLKEEILKELKRILLMIDTDFKIKFFDTSEKDLFLFHFSLGTWIRNDILSENSEIYRLFMKNGIKNKDDMSAVIVRELHRFFWS